MDHLFVDRDIHGTDISGTQERAARAIALIQAANCSISFVVVRGNRGCHFIQNCARHLASGRIASVRSLFRMIIANAVWRRKPLLQR
jgi:hypothetical protein